MNRLSRSPRGLEMVSTNVHAIALTQTTARPLRQWTGPAEPANIASIITSTVMSRSRSTRSDPNTREGVARSSRLNHTPRTISPARSGTRLLIDTLTINGQAHARKGSSESNDLSIHHHRATRVINPKQTAISAKTKVIRYTFAATDIALEISTCSSANTKKHPVAAIPSAMRTQRETPALTQSPFPFARISPAEPLQIPSAPDQHTVADASLLRRFSQRTPPAYRQ